MPFAAVTSKDGDGVAESGRVECVGVRRDSGRKRNVPFYCHNGFNLNLTDIAMASDVFRAHISLPDGSAEHGEMVGSRVGDVLVRITALEFLMSDIFTVVIEILNLIVCFFGTFKQKAGTAVMHV